MEKDFAEEVVNWSTPAEMDMAPSEKELVARRKLADIAREISASNSHTSGSLPSTEEIQREDRER